MIKAFTGVFVLIHLYAIGIAYSAEVTLEWDANSESTVAGYKVYYGTSSRSYDVALDVGNWTSVTIGELDENETYYFAVTAYDLADNESGYSNEVCINCPNDGSRDSSGGGGG